MCCSSFHLGLMRLTGRSSCPLLPSRAVIPHREQSPFPSAGTGTSFSCSSTVKAADTWESLGFAKLRYSAFIGNSINRAVCLRQRGALLTLPTILVRQESVAPPPARVILIVSHQLHSGRKREPCHADTFIRPGCFTGDRFAEALARCIFSKGHRCGTSDHMGTEVRGDSTTGKLNPHLTPGCLDARS